MAQNVNVNPSPASYPTLKAAFDAINAGAHTGSVTIDIVGDTTETATASLNASGSGSASYTSITIQPSGGATRLITGTVSIDTPLIRFNGADNVTMDGLNAGGDSLTIRSSQTNASAAIALASGASNNTLTRLRVEGSANSGVIQFQSAAGEGNDQNTISNNVLTAAPAGLPRRIIFCDYNPATASAASQFNTISGNHISDAHHATQSSSLIALYNGCNRNTISNNRLFQSASRVLPAQNFRAIDLDGTTANGGAQGETIIGNVIGFADAIGNGLMSFSGDGRVNAIFFRGVVGGLSSTVANNRITAIALDTTVAGSAANSPFVGIHVNSGNVMVRANDIGSQVATDAISSQSNNTGLADYIGITSTGNGVIDVIDNEVGGMRLTNTAVNMTAGFKLAGIIINGSATAVGVVTGNRVGGDVVGAMQVVANSTTTQISGIQTANGTYTISGNWIRNLTSNAGTGTGSNASVSGIVNITSSTLAQIHGNRVEKLHNTHSNAATLVTGIFLSGAFNSTASANQVQQLDAASNHANAVITGLFANSQGVLVHNNMVSLGADVAGNAVSAPRAYVGIRESSFNTRFTHNSVLIFGSNVSGTIGTAAFQSTQNSPTRFYLANSFVNRRSNGSGNGVHAAMRITLEAPNEALISNWNNLFADGNGGAMAFIDGTVYQSLANLRSVTTQDANTVSVDPLYVSNTDLHLTAASPIRDLAPFDETVDRDVDHQSRPATNTSSDIGADEFDGSATFAADVGVVDTMEPLATTFKQVSQSAQPRILVGNFGNAKQSNVLVRVQIRDSASALVYDQSLNIAQLDAGARIELLFPAYSLASLGDYTWLARTELLGDLQTANDEKSGTIKVAAALAGAYTVGSGGQFDSLSNFGGAFQVLSALNATAPIELQIISDLSGETGRFRLGQLAANISVLIRPLGGPRVISGSSQNGLIGIESADNVTIDGSTLLGSSADVVGGNASLRELTIINDAPLFGAVIHVINGNSNDAANFTARNLVVQGHSNTTTQFGIMAGVSLLRGSGQNSGVRIENCAARRVDTGFWAGGGSGSVTSTGLAIRNNDLTASGADAVGRVGVYAGNQVGMQIIANAIANISNMRDGDVMGLALGRLDFSTNTNVPNTLTDARVERNHVSGLRNLSTQQSTVGLLFAGLGNNVIANNMISDVYSATAVSSELNAGIHLITNNNSSIRLLHNSVHLLGDRPVSPANQSSSAALAVVGDQFNLVMKNNILANRQTSLDVNFRALTTAWSTINFSGLDADNNLYFAGGEDAAFARTGGVTNGSIVTTLANWRTLSGDDANSLFEEPLFVSNTDLHLQTAPIPSPAISAAAVVAEVTNDFDSETRGASERDIGADEVATPPQGSLAIAPPTLNFGGVNLGSSSDLTVTLNNAGPGAVRVNALTTASTPYSRIAGGTCSATQPIDIAANANCTMLFRFSPIAEGLAQQTITVTHNGTGDTNFTMSGTGVMTPAQLNVSPTTIVFGSVQVGSSASAVTVTVRNTGGQTMTVSGIDTANAPFARNGGTCTALPFDLSVNAACTLIYQFTPAARGNANQAIAINAGAAGSATVNLSGTGTQGEFVFLPPPPTVYNFGSIMLGSNSATIEVPIGNIGDAPLTITAFNGLDAPFERVPGGDCPAGLPIAIASNNVCTIQLRMVGLLAGVFQQTLTTTNDGAGNASAILQGTVIAPDMVFKNGFEDSAGMLPALPKQIELSLPAPDDLDFDVPIRIAEYGDTQAEYLEVWLRKALRADGETVLQIATVERDRFGQWRQQPFVEAIAARWRARMR